MTRAMVVFAVLGSLALAGESIGFGQTIYPARDGTLVDGGIYGTFDGIPDAWDWSFNGSGYEGTITLTDQGIGGGLEHRVVWEYSLANVSYDPPVTATLAFTIRGAPIWQLPDVDIHVFAYPADLQETPEDFASGPAVFLGGVTAIAYQEPTAYSLDVSSAVNEALASGADKVAFRFQVDPDTPNSINQAFMDATDSNPTTKPALTIDEGGTFAGDLDTDGDVDLDDHAIFAVCLNGPDVTVPPDGCTLEQFSDADLDPDGDVDLLDFEIFQNLLAE